MPLWCCHPNKYCDGSNYISQPNNRTRRNRPSEQGVCLFVSEKPSLVAAPENVAAARLWWTWYKVVIPRLLLQNTANVVYSNSSAFACEEEIKEWMCCSGCQGFIIGFIGTQMQIFGHAWHWHRHEHIHRRIHTLTWIQTQHLYRHGHYKGTHTHVNSHSNSHSQLSTRL